MGIVPKLIFHWKSNFPIEIIGNEHTLVALLRLVAYKQAFVLYDELCGQQAIIKLVFLFYLGQNSPLFP